MKQQLKKNVIVKLHLACKLAPHLPFQFSPPWHGGQYLVRRSSARSRFSRQFPNRPRGPRTHPARAHSRSSRPSSGSSRKHVPSLPFFSVSLRALGLVSLLALDFVRAMGLVLEPNDHKPASAFSSFPVFIFLFYFRKEKLCKLLIFSRTTFFKETCRQKFKYF